MKFQYNPLMSQSKKYERSLGVKTTVKQTPASIGVVVHNDMQGRGVAEGTRCTPPEKKRVAHFIERTDPLIDSFSVYALPANRSASAEVRPTHPCPCSFFK